MNNRMKKLDEEIQASLMGIVSKREKAMKAAEATNGDLLGILMESNFGEIEDQGNKNIGMSIFFFFDK